jgi:hypothetical protein
VLFTHIIANPLTTAPDLQLLEQFVSALQTLARLSQAVAKLARLCGVFCKVAELYVGAKKQEVEIQRSSASTTAAASAGATIGGVGGGDMGLIQSQGIHSSDINPYLAAIGFAPPMVAQQYQQQQQELEGGQLIPASSAGQGFQHVGFNGDNMAMDYDATYLNDWYYGNSSLLGLLGQDFSPLNYPLEDFDGSGSGASS